MRHSSIKFIYIKRLIVILNIIAYNLQLLLGITNLSTNIGSWIYVYFTKDEVIAFIFPIHQDFFSIVGGLGVSFKDDDVFRLFSFHLVKLWTFLGIVFVNLYFCSLKGLHADTMSYLVILFISTLFKINLALYFFRKLSLFLDFRNNSRLGRCQIFISSLPMIDQVKMKGSQ